MTVAPTAIFKLVCFNTYL